MLTGFIGIGGGFLLMPGLIKFAKLPDRHLAGGHFLRALAKLDKIVNVDMVGG